MDVKGRRDEYAEITRAAIVAAAIERFAAEGFARASIDAVAAAARVSKGAVYHHFKDKAELFEAAFVALEERLLERISTALVGLEDPWQLVSAGVETFLSECCEPDFPRIALQEAPAALGWDRWKQIDALYFLGLITAGIDGLADAELIKIESAELTARIFLAAANEAGLVVATSHDPKAARSEMASLLMQFLRGLG